MSFPKKYFEVGQLHWPYILHFVILPHFCNSDRFSEISGYSPLKLPNFKIFFLTKVWCLSYLGYKFHELTIKTHKDMGMCQNIFKNPTWAPDWGWREGEAVEALKHHSTLCARGKAWTARAGDHRRKAWTIKRERKNHGREGRSNLKKGRERWPIKWKRKKLEKIWKLKFVL